MLNWKLNKGAIQMGHFTYTPLTEEESDKSRFNLLEPGKYQFTVVNATFKTSSKGYPMITLILDVWDKMGKKHTIKDYLISNLPSMEWKIRHFCKATDLLDAYQSGQFNETLAHDKNGWCIIGIQKGQQKEDGSFYRDKNVIDDYIVDDKITSSIAPLNKPIPGNEFINDDLPF
jgi:hypothetical protein